MNRRQPGLVCPGHDRADDSAEHQTAENEERDYEGGEPLATEVVELLYRLGEDERVGVLLEVAQDGAEARELAEAVQQRVRPVEQDFSRTDWAEIRDRYGEEHHGEGNQKEDVGGDAAKAEF